MSDLKNASHRVSVKLVCMANNSILLIRAKVKETFNLIGGAIDIGEYLDDAIKREFMEETGHVLGNREPKLIHTEIKHFPQGGQFDAVINVFYLLSFESPFEIILEDGVYEEYKWCSKEELKDLTISDHSNKELLASLL